MITDKEIYERTSDVLLALWGFLSVACDEKATAEVRERCRGNGFEARNKLCVMLKQLRTERGL